MPSARLTALRSPWATCCSVWSLRLCSLDFWCSRWLVHELRRISLPFRVARTRLTIPLRVLSLGTGRALLPGGAGGRLPAGGQDHEEVLALEQRLPLDDRERARVVGDPVEDLPADVLVHHLAASEHDRDLHLLACFE